MAFELWQAVPSVDGGIHKLSSTPVKLSGFNGIVARRIALGDMDAGEELALDAAAVAALHPGGSVQSPMFTWVTRTESGATVVQQVLRVIVKCGHTSCDVLLHLRALAERSGEWFPSDRESAEAMQLTGGIGRGLHTWKWSAPKMAIGGAIVGPAPCL